MKFYSVVDDGAPTSYGSVNLDELLFDLVGEDRDNSIEFVANHIKIFRHGNQVAIISITEI